MKKDNIHLPEGKLNQIEKLQEIQVIEINRLIPKERRMRHLGNRRVREAKH